MFLFSFFLIQWEGLIGDRCCQILSSSFLRSRRRGPRRRGWRMIRLRRRKGRLRSDVGVSLGVMDEGRCGSGEGLIRILERVIVCLYFKNSLLYIHHDHCL